MIKVDDMDQTKAVEDVNGNEAPLPAPEVRLLVELEFVQSLCNMSYLHYLASNGYFEDEQFLAFLRYLRYWKRPEYLRHLLFPQALFFLDMIIDDPQFRKEMKLQQFSTFIHQQQAAHWMNFR